MAKRTHDKAFERKILHKVPLNDYYVKIDMFKVLCPTNPQKDFTNGFNIKTTENNNFYYGENIIMKRSKSATQFDVEETLTKTDLINLFSKISEHEVWSAQYETFDKSTDWPKKLVAEIQQMAKEEATAYIKKEL